LSALALAGSIATGATAAAADPCVLELRGDDLTPTWAESLERIRQELEGRFGIDRCANVEVTRTPTGVRVTVVLADGRSTSRPAAAPAALGVVISSLLTVPEVRHNAALEPEPAVVRTRVAGDAVTPPAGVSAGEGKETVVPAISQTYKTLVGDAGPPRAPTANGLVPLRFDLGASGGGRYATQLGYGIGGTAEVTAGGWIVGAGARWESFAGRSSTPAATGYNLTTLDLAIEFGRRIELGRSLALVLACGPSIAAIRENARAPVALNGVRPLRDARVARFGGAARLVLRSASTLQPFLAADANFDVAEDSANDLPVSSSPLPTWTAGLALGMQVRVYP